MTSVVINQQSPGAFRHLFLGGNPVQRQFRVIAEPLT